MKKIIFRGISLKTNKWIAGSLISGIDWNEKVFLSIVPEVKPIKNKKTTAFKTEDFVPVKPQTVGQYILDDMEDTPIYEGDIIIQEYKTTTRNFYGKKTDELVTISGFHLGIARLTTEGAQLCSPVHFEADGSLSEIQPHKNRKIQIRSYRTKVIGNIFEHSHLLKLEKINISPLQHTI